MKKLSGKITIFGLIVGNRGVFNTDLAYKGRKELIERIKELGYDYSILPENLT